MSGVNKSIVIGHLGRDPEVKHLQNGSAVCRLSIATTRVWKNGKTGERQEETEWHRVTVWGKQAEHCAEYLAKGRQVYVEGRLRTTSYERDDYPGAKFYTTEIVAETVQFLGGREHGAPRGDAQQASTGNAQGSSMGQGFSQPETGLSPDDNIPF